MRYLEEVLYYLFKASSHLKEEEVVQQVKNLLSYEEAHEVLMTVAEQLEQKGLQISCKRFPWQGRFSPPCFSYIEAVLVRSWLKIKTESNDEPENIAGTAGGVRSREGRRF